MIQKIRIENFKSHKVTELALGNLTLLCGENGIGKSSIVQSLLLLRQSFQKNRLSEGLDLNKPLCYIGTGKDALYQNATSDRILFQIEDNAKGQIKWEFDAGSALTSTFLKTVNLINTSINIRELSLFNENFQYISAARVADYSSDDYAVQIQNQISNEEGKCELTAHFLSHKQKDTALIKHSQSNFNDILSTTTAWEREISQGVNIVPQRSGPSYEVYYSFDTEKGTTEKFTAKNVGFGLSYALPIIVAIQSAQPGSLLFIENPEAHLHPYGQSKIAELICLAAQAGVQIIVETHSDHILNGVLVASRNFEKSTPPQGIERSKVKVYSFSREKSDNSAKNEEIKILPLGQISSQPSGFFDQIENDINKLMAKENGD